MTDPERDLRHTQAQQRHQELMRTNPELIRQITDIRKQFRNEQDIDEVIARLELPLGAYEELGLGVGTEVGDILERDEGLGVVQARQRLAVSQISPELAGDTDILERVATTDPPPPTPTAMDTDLKEFYEAIKPYGQPK